MKRLIYLGWLVLLASLSVSAADASPGTIKKVEVFPSASEVRVEITLSAAVVPSVETAQHPDRLVVKLPGTTSETEQKRVAVGQYGVRSVRFGLNHRNPSETRLVVDLDGQHPYKITTEGTKIILLIQPSLPAAAHQRNVPVAAASKPLISSLGRASQSSSGTPNMQNRSEGILLTPPPPGPPIELRQGSAQENSDARSTAADTQSSTNPSPQLGPTPPTPVSKEPIANSQASGSPQSSVTANAAQGSAQSQPIPPEPNLSANPSPEPATPVQPASEASLPPASGQAVAENQDQTAATPSESTPAEQTSKEGSGKGRVPQIMARQGENPDFRTAFRVKYVAQDAAYLDGGRAAGLVEGMKLVVRDLPNMGGVAAEGADSSAAGDVAELEVLSVAETSAVTEIHQPKRPVKVGDLAYLSAADQQALVEKNALSATRKYPAVVSFTENDTLDEEARAAIPKPPSPAVNRSRGLIGFDYIGVVDHGPSNMYTNDVGLVVRTDMTRIGGTYWNARGYWRGRFDHTSNSGPQTLQDTINRTYQLYTSYENPNSSWVAGFGRMYLPWATSLDTIDGGYAGRKLKDGVTSGVFFGSTPDPTSWSYAPNRQLGGAFVNFEGGSFDDFHYTSTAGGGLDMLSWSPDRPFIFFENGISYKRIFSIYQASQIDSRSMHTYPCPASTLPISQCVGETLTGTTYIGGNYTQNGTNWGLGRSFTTVRFMPHPRIEFSVNHTYYRDLPFLDPSNITNGALGAGLFDKFLSQGVMGGARVEVLKQIWVSADLGMSSHNGESKNSLNQMFGITFGHVPWVKAHVDARYSRFNSSFGSGSYEALSVTRNLSEGLQLQVLAGQQNFASTLTSANQSRFVNGMVESNLGRHYFVQVGGTINRGNQMNYDQWLFTFGYRFDNRHGQRK